MCAASGTRTRTAITGQGILSPSCLPIPPLRRPVSFVFDVLIKTAAFLLPVLTKTIKLF